MLEEVLREEDVHRLRNAWRAFVDAQSASRNAGNEDQRSRHIDFTMARFELLKAVGEILEEPIDEASLLSN